MGCGMSAEERAERESSRAISKLQQEQADADSEAVKLLLLGAGESGKSTLFKQFRELYGKPLEQSELLDFKASIHSNVLVFMKALCEQATLGTFTNKCSAMEAIRAIEEADAQSLVDLELAAHIKKAWADAGVQETWGRRSSFQIIQSNAAFVDDIDRIAAVDYVPSTADMLRCRVRTSGIVEEQFLISGVTFKVFDVGGQRNERKKWIHCFEGVTAVIFVAAISEYDQALYEMDGVNRMVEALELFDDIANSPFFLDSSIILFLNKRDLFEEKIKRVPISSQEAFSDYSGALGDYDAGAAYFKSKFIDQMKDSEKQVFCHVTCALDTANVRVVFDSCNETIMRQNLASSGFM